MKPWARPPYSVNRVLAQGERSQETLFRRAQQVVGYCPVDLQKNKKIIPEMRFHRPSSTVAFASILAAMLLVGATPSDVMAQTSPSEPGQSSHSKVLVQLLVGFADKHGNPAPVSASDLHAFGGGEQLDVLPSKRRTTRPYNSCCCSI